MNPRVALCIDESTCLNPGVLGLDGESLEAQGWLDVYFTGEEAREGVGSNVGFQEAWVVSSDDVDSINLAATLKADRPDLVVRLVEFEGCGSLFSRAHTANIDEVVDQASFLRRYAEEKGRFELTRNNLANVPDASGVPAAPSVLSDPSDPCAPVVPGSSPIVFESHEADTAVSQFVFEAQGAGLMQASPARRLISQSGRAFLLPVVSGSGGAGKSSVSTMGALIARSMGYRTLLLDYDLQFGDVAFMAGVEQPLPVDQAIAHPDKLEREIRRDPGLAVLSAPERLEAAEETVRAMPQLLETLADLFDVIVANTGAAWAEQHAVLLERCSAALFLVDQRASSVRACQHALELCSRCGIASGPFQFAINRCAKNALLTSADVSCALQGAPVFELKDGGRDVEEFLGGGAASELLETRNEFCTSLEHVMSRLLPGAPERAIDDRPTFGDRRSKRKARHAGRKRGWGVQ